MFTMKARRSGSQQLLFHLLAIIMQHFKMRTRRSATGLHSGLVAVRTITSNSVSIGRWRLA